MTDDARFQDALDGIRKTVERAEQAEAEVERLRRVITQLCDCVEKQAFEIRPPCPQTPILVQIVNQARYRLRSPSVA